MGDIRSGDLFMRLETATDATPLSGFELKGPFSLESTGDLPVARLQDTHFDGDKKETATFVSTGSKAFAIVKGKTYALAPGRVAGLSALVRRPGSSGTGTQLDVGRWMKGTPKVAAGGLIGGVDTDEVTTDLDVAAVIRGLVSLARSFGAGQAASLPELTDADVKRLRGATKTATMSVWTGKKDKTLRKLVMDVEFRSSDKRLTDKVKLLSGIRLRLEASITKLNQPVKVQAPS